MSAKGFLDLRSLSLTVVTISWFAASPVRWKPPSPLIARITPFLRSMAAFFKTVCWFCVFKCKSEIDVRRTLSSMSIPVVRTRIRHWVVRENAGNIESDFATHTRYNPNLLIRWIWTDVSCLLTVNLTSSHFGCRCIFAMSILEKPIGSFGIPRIPLRSKTPLLLRS